MKTAEQMYNEYCDHPIKWMQENNCATTKQITIKLMEAYHEDKTRWISVEESLPDMGQCVLVFVANPFFKDNHIHNSYYDYVMTGGIPCWRGIESNVHGQPNDRIEVTHWQPLPSPPKP